MFKDTEENIIKYLKEQNYPMVFYVDKTNTIKNSINLHYFDTIYNSYYAPFREEYGIKPAMYIPFSLNKTEINLKIASQELINSCVQLT